MRRRLGILLVLTLTAGAACSGDDAEPLPARVTAYLDADVADDPGPIEERIRAVPGVTAVEVTTREQAYEEFKELMKDRPDVVANTSPDTMPTSLEATVPDGSLAEVVGLVIGAIDGVDEAVLGTGRGDFAAQEHTGVILRLTATASGEQRDAVDRLVRDLPGAEAVKFETAAQARERLRKRCGGNRDLAAAFERVTPEDIPSSFRFKLRVDRAKGARLDPTTPIDGVERMLFVPAEVV